MASLFKDNTGPRRAYLWLALAALLVVSAVSAKHHEDNNDDDGGDEDSTEVASASSSGRASCAAKLKKVCCGGRSARGHNVEEKLVGKLVSCMSHSVENILNDIRETPASCCSIPGIKEHCDKKGPENTRLTEVIVNPALSGRALAERQEHTPQCSWGWMERCCTMAAVTKRQAKSLARRAGLIGDLVGCLTKIWKVITGKMPEECCRLPLFSFICGGKGGEEPRPPPGRKLISGSASEDEDCDSK